jgi:hypothetical protein
MIAGPKAGQTMLCTAGFVCTLELEPFIAEENLRTIFSDSTSVKIKDSSCSAASTTVLARTDKSVDTSNATLIKYGWNTMPDTQPSTYRICWCGSSGTNACQSDTEFTYDTGALIVIGTYFKAIHIIFLFIFDLLYLSEPKLLNTYMSLLQAPEAVSHQCVRRSSYVLSPYKPCSAAMWLPSLS